jgi:hypothetical protein
MAALTILDSLYQHSFWMDNILVDIMASMECIALFAMTRDAMSLLLQRS